MRGKLAFVIMTIAVLTAWMTVPAFAAGWALQSIPNPAGASLVQLNGVSCTSASSCIAVGDQQTKGAETTVGEYWNGSTWTIQATLSPSTSELSARSSSSNLMIERLE